MVRPEKHPKVTLLPLNLSVTGYVINHSPGDTKNLIAIFFHGKVLGGKDSTIFSSFSS